MIIIDHKYLTYESFLIYFQKNANTSHFIQFTSDTARWFETVRAMREWANRLLNNASEKKLHSRFSARSSRATFLIAFVKFLARAFL